jgi:hypothetical protein
VPSRDPDLSEFHALTEAEELRKANSKLAAQLRQAKDKTIQFETAVREGVKDAILSLGPVAPVKAPKADKRIGDPHVALWDLGDWQGSKVTPSYNSKIMVERVMDYCGIVERITDDWRSSRPVNDCTIIFGGDMVEGLFNFATQAFEIDQTIFGQYVTVGRLLVDVVRRALSIYDKVHVVPEWGNHGRIGSKRMAVPAGDNIDRMCYELARQLLIGEERLTWQDCPEGIQRLEIGSYRALVMHGDEVGRNGYASPAQIVTHITKYQSGSYPWRFRDAYIHHYHNEMEFSLPNGAGSVFFNGSTESENNYALEGMAASAVPSQRFHIIDPDKGRVVSRHKVWLADYVEAS